MDDIRKTILACRQVLTEGKPGPEHERMKGELDSWAEEREFTKSYKSFTSGEEPDVLCTSDDGMYLFVGDAKNAANEDANNTDTLRRINGYIKKFASLLGKPYHGGRIAIATNSIEAAEEWEQTLNQMCKRAGISTISGNPPAFQIENLGVNSWIIYW